MFLDLLFRRGWFFEKDGSAGGSDNTDDSAGDADKDKKDIKSADAKAGDDAADKTKAEKKFSQADVDNILKDRLEREHKKAEADADKAKKKAEEDALVKNQEFKQLAETRQTKIGELETAYKELEPFKEQAEKYKAALEKQLKAMTEKLPKHILPLLSKMDPIEAMDYLTKNAKELGVSFENYSQTPEGKDKQLTDDEKNAGKQAQASVIRRSF